MKHEDNLITFGEQLKKFVVGGFTLTETLHPPSLVLPRHDHECANVNLTIKGSFREVIGSRPQECSPSSLLVKPPGEAHANHYGDAGARCLIIEVSPERLESIRTVSKFFDTPAHIQGGALSALAMSVYKELLAADDASGLMIEGLVLEMLGEATRESLKDPTAPPRWLLETREIIREQFAESLSLSNVATRVGVHPTHLARTFRKYYGCTIGEYVRHLRLNFAARELAGSDKSLTEIALAAGFCDQSHFSNVFKLYMKLTPAEFRTAFQTGKARPKKLRSFKTS